ncbi:MAG: 4-amino-4-deoxy-L-arabinose transferase [Nocardioidaceae bacterium]
MTSRFPHLDDLAAGVVSEVLGRPPSLGSTRLVCVDGPAGSGKTTLAAALNRSFRDALRPQGAAADRAHVQLIHMDNVFAGWTGLDAGMATVATSVVPPLAEGRAGRYRRYDWHRGGFAEERVVGPVDVLLVEGVGSGASAYDDKITCLIWVDTPSDVRLARGLERDGERLRDSWLAWSVQEDVMFARERTRERADLVVDGQTGHTRSAAT